MSKYSDAELSQLRLIDRLVREEMHRMGLPANPKTFDELIASGALKAAECLVRSKDLVDPNWLERARRANRQPPRLTVVDMPKGSQPG